MNGFDQVCNDPYNEFLFASVNLAGAQATPIACIPTSAVDQEDEWYEVNWFWFCCCEFPLISDVRISSFSLDGSIFATASGDGDSGQAQLLVLDATNGRTIYNNALNGLGQALQSASGVYWIWGVNFISASAKTEKKAELQMRFMNSYSNWFARYWSIFVALWLLSSRRCILENRKERTKRKQ